MRNVKLKPVEVKQRYTVYDVEIVSEEDGKQVIHHFRLPVVNNRDTRKVIVDVLRLLDCDVHYEEALEE